MYHYVLSSDYTVWPYITAPPDYLVGGYYLPKTKENNLTEYYVVCNVANQSAVKSEPLETFYEARILLQQSREEMPKHEFWIMECIEENLGLKVKIHKNIEPILLN